MGVTMTKDRKIFLLGMAAVLLIAFAAPCRAERIKDLAVFEGVRENPLLGYSLVVGINGDGDNKGASVVSTVNLLKRMGLVIDEKDIKSKNVAAVMVTGSLPPFPKPGTRINVTVSAMGDAKIVGGEGGNKVVKNHPTVGSIPGGGIVEADLPFTLGKGESLRLFLHRQDFTNATRIASRINEELKAGQATAVDPATVRIAVPEGYKARLPELISSIEALQVPIDVPARVTVNEKTGTVVIGENVRISPVAIAHGNLTIEVKTDYQVSQPNPFAPHGAETVVTPQQQVAANESRAALMEVSGASLGEIVRALNALGVSPRDLIAILQALRTSGALRAELEIL
ncbi:MAG: flgI [Deltaproteobacteria bacterium]|nr:flgI [Deltaproteobacteria bacterium]